MPARRRVRSLSEAEVAALRRLERRTRDAAVYARCLMLLHANEGLTPRAIGRLLERSPDTVRRAIRRYEQAGLQGLLERDRSDRARRGRRGRRHAVAEASPPGDEPGSTAPTGRIDDHDADVGHEVRSALSTILGYARLLASVPAGSLEPERQSAYVDEIVKAGTYVVRLIDELLDLRRLESGVEPLRPVRLDLAPFLDSVLRAFRARAEEKGVATSLDVEAGLPPIVTDELLVRRAIDNLLSNAIKYTPTGGSVRLAASREGRGVAIAVADTGIGLAEDERARVFERFYRGRRTEVRSEAGSGLGLALVSEVARRLGGEIRVSSVVGRGSTFTFWLPARHADVPANGGAQDRRPGPGRGG